MTTLGPVLSGARVLLTAQRRAGDFAQALERRGAEVVIAPSLGMESHIDEHTLLAQTRRIIDLHADSVVVTTGIGFRGWLETAEVAGLGHELLAALAETRLIARIPLVGGQQHGDRTPSAPRPAAAPSRHTGCPATRRVAMMRSTPPIGRTVR